MEKCINQQTWRSKKQDGHIMLPCMICDMHKKRNQKNTLILYIREMSTLDPSLYIKTYSDFAKTKSYDTRGYPLSMMGIYMSKGGQELK
jgi:hypothetical protein